MSDASNYAETAILDGIRNSASFVVTQTYVFVHTGDPGEDGSSNFALNTTGKAITWNAPSSPGGTMTSAATALWTSVATTETYSHASVRSGTTTGAGSCILKSALNASVTVNIGDNFSIPAGSMTITVS